MSTPARVQTGHTTYPFGRILLMDLSHQTGGASTRTLGLLKHLPAGMAGLAVVAHSEVAQEAERSGLPVHVLGPRKTSASLGWRLRALVAEGGYGIVDTQNAQSQFWAAAARLPASTAVVSTLNSWYRDEYGGASPRGLFYHGIVQFTRPATDHYIAVSAAIRARLLSLRVPASRVSTIPAAVSVDADGVADSRRGLRQMLGLGDGDLLLCSLGRLVVAKDYPTLIAAMATLPPHVHLAIAGEGPLREALVLATREAGLSGRIHFMGTIPHREALELIKAADVFVMSSSTEGTPVVLLEAAALAKPIVATRVGGIPELFPCDDAAVLVAPGDPSALAAALRAMIDDPRTAEKRGGCAGERVYRTHGIAGMLNATLQAYAAAWAQRARPERVA